MADWAFRTLITTAATTATAQSIAVTLSPTGGQNMWITPLSASGNEPATHYVSTGLISPEFAMLVPEQVWEWDAANSQWMMVSSTPGDPVLCYQMCVDGGLSITQAQVNAVYAAADVTEQEPFVAFSRLGLKIVQTPL